MNNHGFQITCRCGHRDDYEKFERSPSGIELDPGVYQCPACNSAWKIKPVAAPTIVPNGFVVPSLNKIVEVNSTL